jgi:DNA repair exonuclease SbcCD ATPase subunit
MALEAAATQQEELETLRSAARGRRFDLEEQVNEASAKLQETHDREIKDLTAQIKKGDDSNAALQRALNEASTEIERLNGQVREKEDEITNLHAMAEKIEKMADDSLVDTAALEEENARLVQANEDLGKIRGELTNLEETRRRVQSELTQSEQTNALLAQRMEELNTRYDHQVVTAERMASFARRATLSKNEMRSKLTGVEARQAHEKQEELKKYARLKENPVLANAQLGAKLLKTTKPVDVRSYQVPPAHPNVAANVSRVQGRVDTIERVVAAQKAKTSGEGAGAGARADVENNFYGASQISKRKTALARNKEVIDDLSSMLENVGTTAREREKNVNQSEISTSGAAAISRTNFREIKDMFG